MNVAGAKAAISGGELPVAICQTTPFKAALGNLTDAL
jgi:hypothetical protein